MKILLDNCVDVWVKRLFVGHVVEHARDRGWRQLENGKLLAAAAIAGFEVMASVDKNIRFQQNLNELPIPILELNTMFTRRNDLGRLLPFLPVALEATQRFWFVSVDDHGQLTVLVPREPRGPDPA